MADKGRSEKDVVNSLEEAEAEDEKLAQRLREDRSKVASDAFGGSGGTRQEQREPNDESQGVEYL